MKLIFSGGKVASIQWSILNKLRSVKNNCRCSTTSVSMGCVRAQTTTISCKAAAKNIQKGFEVCFVCLQTQSVPHLRVWTKQITQSKVVADLWTTHYGFVAEEQSDTRSYQNRGKSPKIQLFGGQAVSLALGAVVHLILPQLLLAGEGSQTTVQVDGLCLGSAALFNTFVFFHDLKGEKAVCDLEMEHTLLRGGLSSLYHTNNFTGLFRIKDKNEMW